MSLATFIGIVFVLLIVGFICYLVWRHAPIPPLFKTIIYFLAFIFLFWYILNKLGILGGSLRI